ncbi:MAG: hypothetical protein MJ078_06075, partial [Clostridia bacterium]|nr:hypothetical protein [Clostridia bacterium]
MKPFEGKRIYLLGDSISSTDYVWYKEALEEETGALVYNAGFSGHKTESIASNTAFQRLIDFDADITVALVMGNDTGEKGTVGTFSSSSPNGLSGEPLAEETDLAKDFLDPVTKNPQSPLAVCGVSHIIRTWRHLFYDFKRIAGLTGGV